MQVNDSALVEVNSANQFRPARSWREIYWDDEVDLSWDPSSAVVLNKPSHSAAGRFLDAAAEQTGALSSFSFPISGYCCFSWRRFVAV